MTKDLNGFQREGIGGNNRTWPSRGEEKKSTDYNKFEIATKLRKSKIWLKLCLLLPFERCYMIFIRFWFIIYIVTSLTGYADDIFHVFFFLIFTFKDQNVGENLTNLAENLNTVGPRGIHRACFFQLQGPREQKPSGVVVRIVEGKSRAEALLNTAVWCPLDVIFGEGWRLLVQIVIP